ncbi:MAG: CRISPR-associated CARF protein Csx1 [Thermofilaceae archaeon]|nr:CRISPR-associated CARF protein Csx1 [Thermofilaceae archaeon]MCX8180001.1 CRISPR-associated CARF protein Csx1 [Thermofilaceae archaeon]MDW8004693.1 CRISPR-associated CARF protein Csx1 [Thermofilaceae archaeon]
MPADNVKTLIVATWGDPRNWSSVKYRVKGLEKEGEKEEVLEGKCSLLPLMLKAGCDARAIVVVADTLFSTFEEEQPRAWANIEERVRNKVKLYWESFVESSKVNGVELSSDTKDRLKNSVEVVVCPGLGRYKFGDFLFEFRGSLELFMSTILLHVLERALGMGRACELWLDLSHGVNYMPSAALIAVSKVGRILSFLAKRNEVKLRVFNSDPYSRGVDELFINEMELSLGVNQLTQPDIDVDGNNLVKVVYDLLERPDTLFGRNFRSEARSLLKLKGYAERISSVLKVYKDLWFSASYCLPLLALHRVNEELSGQSFFTLIDLVKTVRETFYEILRSVKVTREDKILTMDTANTIDPGRWRLLDTLFEVYAVIERLYEVREWFKPLDRGGRYGFRLSDVMKLVECHLQRTAPVGINFIGREVQEILRYVSVLEGKGIPLDSWRLYDDLKDLYDDLKKEASKCKEELKTVDERLEENFHGLTLAEWMRMRTLVRYREDFTPNFSDRNFLAHLGLTYRDIEVYYENLSKIHT